MGSLEVRPFIDLQGGWPTPSLLPTSILQEAVIEVLSDPSSAKEALLYGPQQGHHKLTKSVAKWLTSCYEPLAGEVTPERILISCGASHNLATILQIFSDPLYTKGVWMVEPTYFLACKIFEDAGFQEKLQGVPENEEGIDVEFLRAALKATNEDGENERLKTGPLYPKLYKHIIYCTPTFSNPSAKTWSLATRKALIEVAREFDALIVSDDCYDFLCWPKDESVPIAELGPHQPRLVDVDRSMSGGSTFGNSVSNGSFSKILGPGARVGWAEGTAAFIAALSSAGPSESGGNPSQLTSSYLDRLLVKGSLQQHIQKVLVPTYRKRYSILMNAIEKHLVPLGVSVSTGTPVQTRSPIPSLKASTRPSFGHEEVGGFFTYLIFPSDLRTTNVIASRAFKEFNVKFAFGDMFRVKGDNQSGVRKGRGFRNTARLCWAWETEDALAEGPRRIAEVIMSFRGNEVS